MKRIGLIGGLSWHSTNTYYAHINQTINKNFSKHHSAEIVLVSVDFQKFVIAFERNQWDIVEKELMAAVELLEKSSVDFFLLCCNTVHKVAERIKQQTALPMLHILDPIGKNLNSCNIKKVALFGTRFTMQDDFHREYLKQHYAIDTIIPSQEQINEINRIIFSELCFGVVKEKSQKFLYETIFELKCRGAEASILACTELHMVFQKSFPILPVFDTTLLHAEAAAVQASRKIPWYQQEEIKLAQTTRQVVRL